MEPPKTELSPPPEDEPSELFEENCETIDKLFHAYLGKWTLGVSPPALWLAYMDWWLHLGLSPGKQMLLGYKAWKKNLRWLEYLLGQCTPTASDECISPLPEDHRFSDPQWEHYPFYLYYQQFLLTQQWWENATVNIRGVSCHHEQLVSFSSRQILDALSPANWVLTNPNLFFTTLLHQGSNLHEGGLNYLEDLSRAYRGDPPLGHESFTIGENIATTKGKVIYRNELLEILFYEPTTEKVYPEPLLIIPPWIMKYYVLDLQPETSMVKYLVDSGFCVFMISWKNPTKKEAEYSFENYVDLGALTAIQEIERYFPKQKIHAMGYCVGGTLLSVVASYMARIKDYRLKSISLLAGQVDFVESGEMLLFIDESQLAFLKDLMWEQGYLNKLQMKGAFQMLRSLDLVWSRMQQYYLLEDQHTASALVAWNSDATRIPYRMHSEYLRNFYLRNAFSAGRLQIHGKTIGLKNLKEPIFLVGTLKDHIAPWKSVYKMNLFSTAPITFTLTNGGHAGGIICGPENPKRHYYMSTSKAYAAYRSPEKWQMDAPCHQGSWWIGWRDWLKKHSTHTQIDAPPYQDFPDLGKAPGKYVFEK